MAELTGSSEELAYDTTITDGDTIVITGDVTATIDELKTINNATSGAITLNTETAASNYSGTAADLAAVMDGFRVTAFFNILKDVPVLALCVKPFLI